MASIRDVQHSVVEADRRQLLFVRIRDEDGCVGYGEATLAGQIEAVQALLDTFGGYLQGQDAGRIQHHWNYLYRGFWKGGFTYLTALAAVETALWDLLARRLDQPLYQLLGGATRDRIRAYTHFGGATPDEAAEVAQQRVAEGWTALKSFPNLSADAYPADPIPGLIANMRAARHAVGDDIELGFDCHGRFGFADSLRMAQGLADLDFAFIEEPLAPENVDQTARFCDRSPVAVAMGERLQHLADFASVLSATTVAYMQPDPMRCGGISVTHTVGALCGMRKVHFAPHNSPGTGPVASAAVLHIAAATHAFSVLETRAHLSDVERAVCTLRLEPVDGYLPLPSGPGLGIELDWDAVVAAKHRASVLMPRGFRDDGTVQDY